MERLGPACIFKNTAQCALLIDALLITRYACWYLCIYNVPCRLNHAISLSYIDLTIPLWQDVIMIPFIQLR
jgi:hypothetical protein